LPEKITVPDMVKKSADLTFYGIIARYPAEIKKVTSTEWKKCITKAMDVYLWAEKIIVNINQL